MKRSKKAVISAPHFAAKSAASAPLPERAAG
jgi:hypothetical protein